MTSKLINGKEINASKIDVEEVGTKNYERINIKIDNNQDSKRKKETKVNKVQVNSKRPKHNLTLYQCEEVISKIGDERHFLFGKLMDGITREKRDEYRGNFLKWCKVRGIQYKSWKKVEDNWYNWKSQCRRNQRERENQAGSGVKPRERWEQMLANFEIEDSKLYLKYIKNFQAVTKEKDNCKIVSLKCNSCEQFFSELLYSDHVNLCKQYLKYLKKTSKGYQCQICLYESSSVLSKIMIDHLKKCLLEHNDIDLDSNERQIKTSINVTETSKVIQKYAKSRLQKLSDVMDHEEKQTRFQDTIISEYESSISNMPNSDFIQNTFNVVEIVNDVSIALLDDIQRKSERIELFSCDLCKVSFEMEIHLKGHLKSVHKKEVLNLAITNIDELDVDPLLGELISEETLEISSDLMKIDQENKNDLKRLKLNSSSLTGDKEKVLLSYSQREEVLTKIATEREILFGKVQDGITRIQKDKCRDDFLKWCLLKEIPYRTWGKVNEHYNNWKRDWKKEPNWIRCKPQEKWELLLEMCESQDLKMDQKKKNRLKQLKLNRSSLKKDIKVILSYSQREEVLTKIVTDREFLLGKLKDGNSIMESLENKKKIKCRDDFLKWCQLRGIPYQTWGNVLDNYYNWKSNFYKNKCERENTGAMAKPLENWERLLATCEREWN